MILSKRAVLQAIEQGKVAITPFSKDQVEAAHINLHLYIGTRARAIVVTPKSFLIARTLEKITLADDMCAFMEGKAGLAKQGLSVEQSSTFIEPGSDNFMTLEIFNAGDEPVRLEAGQPIAKMFLMHVVDDLKHLG